MKLFEIRELQEKLEYEYYRQLFTILTKEELITEKKRIEAEIDFALDAYYEAEDTEQENVAWATYSSVKTLHRVALKVIDDIMCHNLSQAMCEFYNAKTGETNIYFGGNDNEEN